MALSKPAKIALALSLGLHASVVLVRCGPAPTVPEPQETLVELKVPEPPVVAASARGGGSPPPPRHVQPAPEPPKPNEPPPPPPTPDDVVVQKPVDSTPPTQPSQPTAPENPGLPPLPPGTRTLVGGNGRGNGEGQGEGDAPGKGSGGNGTAIVGSEQLDNRDFKPFGNQKPTYPEVARQLNVEGYAELQIIVGTSGKVESITVLKWKGHPSFGEAAKETARAWRFAPPRHNGNPAKALYVRTIEFRLQ